MRIAHKLLSLTMLVLLQFPLSAVAVPVPLTGGTALPNKPLRVRLDNVLIANRYYKVTCDIENQYYGNQDPVVMSLMGGWSAVTPGPRTGGVGKILLNGHELLHSQALLDQFENKYEAFDVWVGYTNGLQLWLTFINYHPTSPVTVRDCFADYMVK